MTEPHAHAAPAETRIGHAPLPAVLFDLDGTLIDSIGLIVESFHHTFAAFGLPARSDETWLHGIGTPLRGVLAPWARDEAMLDAMVAVYRAHNLAHHDARVRAYPGVAGRGARAGAGGDPARHGDQQEPPGHAARAPRGRARGRHRGAGLLRGRRNAKPHREPVDRAVALLGADPGGDALRGRQPARHARGPRRGGSDRRGALGPVRPRPPGAASEPSHWLASPEDVLGVVLG